jgi:3(or 17)beta-hydroxysteroid dehydrogenase
MGRVEGKRAVVTGAASGIGRQCAMRLAEHGAQVVVADRDDDNGVRVTAELNAQRAGSATFVRLDVTSPEQWATLGEHCQAQLGGLDILVNAAGLYRSGTSHNPETETLEDWRAIQGVNVEGLMLGCQTALAAMRSNGGSIINISSIAGIKASIHATAYGASKGAVRQYTKSLAAHCARRNYGIRCNSIHPGIIETPMGQNAMSRADGDLEQGRERYRKAIPMRAIGAPDDIAYAVLYLASDESRYVTGIELIVDGGVTML